MFALNPKNSVLKNFRLLITFLFFLSTFSSQAQLDFSQTEYDFGILNNWSDKPAIFEFVNTSGEKLAILKVERSPEVHINYPTNYILKNQKGKIFVYYEALDLGNFHENIFIYTSASMNPIKLVVKGKTNSFLSCPGGALNKEATNLVFEQNGLVIDGENSKAIQKAKLTLINSKNKEFKTKTSKDGSFKEKLDIGLYLIIVEAEGYQTLEHEEYLNINTGELVFKLFKGNQIAQNETDKEPQQNELMHAKPTAFFQSGIIVDSETAKPIDDATIKLTNKKTRLPYYFKTYQDGKFRKLLRAGDYDIEVTADGYKPYGRKFELYKDKPGLSIQLIKEAVFTENTEEKEVEIKEKTVKNKEREEEKEEEKITKKENENKKAVVLNYMQHGEILDSKTMKPIAGAIISLTNLETNIKYYYKTFGDGKFKKDIKPGIYKIDISKKNYKDLSKTLELKKGTTKLKILLEPLKKSKEKLDFAQILTIVDKETMEPIKGAYVKLYNRETKTAYDYRTMNDGKFKKKIKPGIYEITIKAEGYKDLLMTKSFSEELGDLNLTLEKEEASVVVLIEEEDVKEEEIIEEEKKIIKEKEEIKSQADDYTFEKTEEKKEEIITAEVNDIENKLEDIETEGTGLLPVTKYAANNIVFLIDVSSSMKKAHKIENLKNSIKHLTKILRDIDLITLISYDTEPHILVSSIPADQKDTLLNAISNLKAFGFTYGLKGLNKAYDIAQSNFIVGGNNQVIIATDGEFNSPDYSEIQLVRMILDNSQDGIILSVIGFGKERKAIRRMKTMAGLGKGNFLHITNDAKAKSILIEEIKLNSKIENK
ncbi:MAG: carboxypeptidase regulatory-like domain-containing protein [Bacteroidota bacterium]|nr:carboxypeptidase regulatory-like domain-containing protein [Bacteroidota bacterium]